jgi:hypothetical protein
MDENGIINKVLSSIETRHRHWIIPLLTAIGILAIWTGHFKLSTILQDTILTGGDSASWYQTAYHLKHVLIPEGRLFGWSQANYFGFNELQSYFTVPFLVAVLLSLVMPLTIALKIAFFSGSFLIPAAAYWSIFTMTKKHFAGSIAAFSSLIFVFNESYYTFGGNLSSTLAGEFSYSMAMPLFILMIGLSYRMVNEQKSPIFPGIVLGLTGLTHVFVFMPAFFVPFFFVCNNTVSRTAGKIRGSENIDRSRPGKTATSVAITYLIAFGILSFWLIPFLAGREFTTPLSILWRFNSFSDFAKQTFLPFVLAGITLVSILIIMAKKFRTPAVLFAWLFGVSIFLMTISSLVKVPDIRFVPVAVITSCLAIALFMAWVFTLLDKKMRLITPIAYLLVCTGCIIMAHSRISRTPAWMQWVAAGYEARSGWSDLQKITDNCAGTPDQGRLLWEKLDAGHAGHLGSERAFENLYYFTGRPSAEGVHYASSHMSRATTYMQSEYSVTAVDPESYRIYSVIKPDKWADRFRLVNGSTFIANTDEIKRLMKDHPDFEYRISAGRYDIFEFKKPAGSYIEILDPASLVLLEEGPGGFTSDFYHYFRRYPDFRMPFIPAGYADKKLPGNLETFKTFREYEKKAMLHESDTILQTITGETVDDMTIRFTTGSPDRPHLIKVSYSPNFKSSGGERIYPVSPGFMLLYPQSENVEIRFGRTAAEILGIIITLLTILSSATMVLLVKLKGIKPITLPAVSGDLATGLFSILVILMLVLTFSGSRTFEKQYFIAETLANEGKNDDALKITRRYATEAFLLEQDNEIAYRYHTLHARLLVQKRKFKDARYHLELVLNRYPGIRIWEEQALYWLKQVEYNNY